jgi:hypothetical protein
LTSYNGFQGYGSQRESEAAGALASGKSLPPAGGKRVEGVFNSRDMALSER